MVSRIISAGSANSLILMRIRNELNNNMVSSHAKAVFTAYPEISAEDQPGYPFGVVRGGVDISRSTTLSGLKMCEFDVTTTFYGTDARTVNEACDKAYRVLEEGCSKSGVESFGFHIGDINSTSLSTGFIGEKAIHEKDVVVTGWVETTI